MDPRARLRENPFYVLAVPTDASRADVERVAQRLLGELALGRQAVKEYRTPLGPAERTAERVRAAVAELRDPRKRALHELWASTPAGDAPRREPVALPRALSYRWLGARPR
jgi:hypothetical protein